LILAKCLAGFFDLAYFITDEVQVDYLAYR